MSNSEKKMKASWIRDCLFEYVAKHLDGMEEYFYQCWEEARRAVSDVPDFEEWIQGCRAQSTLGDMVGELWFRKCNNSEDLEKFMTTIDFGGYVDQFKEDFEVNIYIIESVFYYQKTRFEIEIKML